jgi:tetratricopeptide (TPR) repeat protein
MPKKSQKKSKKTSAENGIEIKIKKAGAHESFWEGADFQKSNKEEKAKNQVKKEFEWPKERKAPKAKKIIKKTKKINKKTYVLFSVIIFFLLLLFFLVFFVRPSWAHTYEQNGDKEIQNKEMTYALEDYQKGLTLSPRSSSLNLKLAQIYLDKNLTDNAQKYAQAAKRLDQNNKEADLVLAETYLNQKNYAQAYDNYKNFLVNSDDARAYIGLLKTLIAQNNKGEAESLAQKSFLLYPDNSEIIFYRSLIWFWQGDYTKAQEGFDKVSHDQNQELAEKSKMAIETIDKIKDMNPSSYQKVILGNFFNQMDLPTMAAIYFKEALSKDPSYRDIYLGLGQSFLAQNNFSEAENQFNKALEIDPVSGLAFYLLGRSSASQNLPDKALIYYQKAIDRGYDNAGIRKDIAEAYLNKNNYSKVLEAYEKALTLSQDDPYLYSQIVTLLDEKLDRAGDALKTALEAQQKIGPSKSAANNILARAYLANNELSLAHQYIDKAIAKNPSSAENYYTLALIYQKENNSEESEKYFIRAADYDNSGTIFNQAYEQIKNM